MSKKNNRGKDKRYVAFLLKKEQADAVKLGELRKKKANAIIRAMESQMTEKRKTASRKPKVAPVMGSKVKMDKMLKKSMKALSIGSAAATKGRKIDMASDNDSDSDMEGDEQNGQAAALAVPRQTLTSKQRIKKERQSITKAQENYMKKEIRRRLKMGSKKDARKLREKLDEGISFRNGRV